MCIEVVGLNLHNSFAPVRKEECKIIIMMIAFMGYIL